MRKTNSLLKRMISGLTAVLTIIIALCSCTDEMYDMGGQIKYDDGQSILVKVSSEIPDAVTRTEYNLATWHTEFADGDEIGVFAYNGTSVIASNVKFTYDGTDWIPEVSIPYNDSYTYLAYYPYSGTNGNPPYAVATSGTADARLASYITDSSNKFHYADQSTQENFAKSDYMHAQGVDAGSRTITFTMQHKKALAVMASTVNKWYDTTDPMTPHDTYVTFSGKIPLTVGEYKYFLCKNGVATTIGGTSFTGQSGKYLIKDASVVTGTPTLTYSTSTDGGSTWSSFSGTKPSWLTVTADVVEDMPTDFNVTMASTKTTSISKGTSTTRTVEADATLKAATKVTGFRDLSMYDNAGNTRASRTTANCYMVHAPGEYKLPLVYGNAIVDGDESSTDAFYTTQTSNTLQRLLNHANQGITSPWIKDNTTDGSTKISIDGAKLAWEDVKGMVSSVSIDGDYLKFTIDEDNIAEGNAVVAATSGGTVVWSWHIWVTTQTFESLTSVSTGYTYQVAPVNVGQITGTIQSGTIYAGSQTKVRATTSGAVVEFLVTQPDYFQSSASYVNPAPYYQWGRKDPLYPSFGAYDADGNTVTYSSSSVPATFVSSTANTIGLTIQNPDVFYHDGTSNGPYGNGANAKKYNYWNMDNTVVSDNLKTATKKTVYDPCPPGMCVPTSGLYYYIAANYSTYFAWNTNKRTWTMNTPNIVFPAAGYRNGSSGALGNIRSGGYYWSSVPNSATYGYSLDFYSSSANINYNYRSNGFPVRAVLEE